MKARNLLKLFAALCAFVLLLAGCGRKGPASGSVAPLDTTEREQAMLQMLDTVSEETAFFAYTPPETTVWMRCSIVEYVDGVETARSEPMFGIQAGEGMLVLQLSSRGEVYMAYSGGASSHIPAATSGPFASAAAFGISMLGEETEVVLSQPLVLGCVMLPKGDTLSSYDTTSFTEDISLVSQYAAIKVVTISFEPEISLAAQAA